MKRKFLVEHLTKNGCGIVREGKRHTVFSDKSETKTSVVPRHKEINEFTAKRICRDLGVPEP
jgi:hypothetical protein